MVFCETLNMVVGNAHFKKKNKYLVTYESGGMVSQIDYILVRKVDRNRLKDVSHERNVHCSASW